MSNNVNTLTHSQQITSSHKRILDSDPSVSWAVYGFDKGTNDMNLEATGVDDLDEMIEHFDSGKVQYAFVRIVEPTSKLTKFVFVSWCGSGVPVFKKALLGSQIGDIQAILQGYHVTINARAEDDLSPEIIYQKVAESSGSTYSSKPPVISSKPKPKPGVYYSQNKPSNPGFINPAQQPPAKPFTAQNKPPVAAKPSSYASKYKPGSPSPQIGGTKPLFGTAKPASSYFGVVKAANSQNTSFGSQPAKSGAFSPNSYQLKNQSVVAPKVGTFGSKTESSAPFSKPSFSPEKKATSPISTNNALAKEASSSLSQAEQTKNELAMLRSKRITQSDLGANENTFKSSISAADERKAELENIRHARNGSSSNTRFLNQTPTSNTPYNYSPAKSAAPSKSFAAPISLASTRFTAPEPPKTSAKHTTSTKNQAIVLYSYEAEESNEIDLVEGEIITNVDQIDDGWWSGTTLHDNKTGLFPANFVEMVPENEDQNGSPQQPQAHHQSINAFSKPSLPQQLPATSSLTSPPPQPPVSNSYISPPPPPPPAQATSTFASSAPPPPPPPPQPSAANSYVPPPPPPPPPPPAQSAGSYIPPPPPPPPQATSSFAPPPPPPPPMGQQTYKSPAAAGDLPPPLPNRNSSISQTINGEPAPPPLPVRAGSIQEKETHPDEYTATALYEYEAVEEGELNFDEGEILTDVQFPSDEWWQGFNKNGEFGLFPANYVELNHR